MNRRDLEQAVDEELVRREAEGPLYHVTYYGRLPDIAEEGLAAGRARSIGAAAYDAHARGRLFLTEPEGVKFWHGRAEAFAEHESDQPHEDGLVPVVLRVHEDCFEPEELEVDDLGTRDALAPAWAIRGEPFPADCLDVYAGPERGWVPVEDYGVVDPLSAFDVQPNPDFDSDEYGDEPEDLYYFKWKSPLEPELS